MNKNPGKITQHIFTFFFSFVSMCLYPQPTDTSILRIAFAGDIMGHDGQISGAWVDSLKGYNYEPTFRYIKPFLDDMDIAVANLEVTLAGPPYTGYPQFSSPDSLAIEARKAGFDILLTANNHALDRGAKGLNRTIAMADSLHIIHTGSFISRSTRNEDYPLILEKNGIRLALLNYTYGTNGITIKPPSVINRIDTVQIRTDLEKAELAEPDFTLVAIHWGIEYERFENNQQTELAMFMLKNGADAIIGSHPHVVQPVKLYYPGTPDSTFFNLVVYSLGNFVSNQRSRYRNGGIIFEFTIQKTGPGTRITEYSYLPVWAYRKDEGNKSTFYILPPSLFFENEAFFGFPDYERYKITEFYSDTREHLRNIPENMFYENYRLGSE